MDADKIIDNLNTSVFLKETAAPRAVIGATCFLSIIGSAAIVLTFIAFKELRGPTRRILLHLSLMDLGVALANFVGCVAYFDRFYYQHFDEYDDFNVGPWIEYSCKIQAAVAVTCNNSSVLWTIAVAVYLYFRIVSHPMLVDKRFFSHLIIGLAVFSYGLPILITVWLLLTHRLGFAPYDSSGWCTLIVLSPDRTKDDIIAGVLGNDAWICIAFLMIPALYLSIKLHAKNLKQYAPTTPGSQGMLQLSDLKFTAIPLIFILLRLSSMFVSILYEYFHLPEDTLPNSLNIIILYSSGIGDSAQGAANGILFILFTKKTRDLIVKKLCCKNNTIEDEDDETSNLLIDENTPVNSSYSTSDPASKHCKTEGRTLVIIQDV